MTRLILGTMRLHEHDRSLSDWAAFFAEAWDLGVRKLHSSKEYESWSLLRDILKELAASRPDIAFGHVIKVGVPHFGEAGFDPTRLRAWLDEAREGLEVECIDDVQWMWRDGLDDDAARIAAFEAALPAMADAIATERSRGAMGRFLCFPYSVDFAMRAVDTDLIDGLVVYRNDEERDYDGAIEAAHARGKPSMIIRPFFGGKTLESSRPAREQYRDAVALDGIEGAIVSCSKVTQLRELIDA